MANLRRSRLLDRLWDRVCGRFGAQPYGNGIDNIAGKLAGRRLWAQLQQLHA